MKTTQQIIEELMSDPEKRRQEASGIRRHMNDYKWVGDNYESLLRQYPDEFIAVYDKRVIAHGKDIPTLHSNLSDQYRNKGVVVRYIIEITSSVNLIGD